MYRKAYQDLLRWKESSNRKPLLLLGARQVGKTWLMKEFGRCEYENVVYINCDTEPLTKELFLYDYDIRRLLMGFQAISGETINEHTTLIILDEIQEAPRGLHSLKYFCENAPGYHVIAAGSLLGVTLSQKESYPVGKVDILRIYPMDFEEFLYGIGQKSLCDVVLSRDNSMISTFSGKLVEFLRQYYYVGGMPEVVRSFADKRDLNEVRQLQTAITDAYRRDISKHSSKPESIRIGQVLSSLPAQLSRENKKFIYGAVKKGSRAADFEMAIQWLADAGLVYKVNRLKKVAVPLKFYEEMDAFKLFFIDVGLLGCMAGLPATVILESNSDLTEYKGMMAEQYAAQQLVAAGIELFYWSNDRTPAELDFVIQLNGEVYPVEVKASTNVRGKSIAQFTKDNPGKRGLRFSLLDFREQENLTNYPLYTLPFFFSKHA